MIVAFSCYDESVVNLPKPIRQNNAWDNWEPLGGSTWLG